MTKSDDRRKSDLFTTSMITYLIGQQKVFLSINRENYNYRVKKNSQVTKEKGKFALKDWQRRRDLFDVALKLTTIKMNVIGWFKIELWMWLAYWTVR